MAGPEGKLRVALLCPSVGMWEAAGGVAEHVRCLVPLLTECQVTLVGLASKWKVPAREAPGSNPQVVALRSLPLPMTIRGPLLEPFRLARAVNRLHPDLVHAQMIGAPYAVAALLLSHRYPTVLTVHTTVHQRSTFTKGIVTAVHDLIWSVLERLEIRRVSSVIAVSQNVADELQQVGARRVTVIPNGVSRAWFDLLGGEVEGRVLFLGRVTRQKGIEHLLGAARILLDRGRSFELNIMGPAEDRAYARELEELAHTLRLGERVRLQLRFLPEAAVFSEYAACCVFVLPSIEESSPIALLQAMAAGKAIVSTKVGGIPEILEDRRTALLVAAGDSLGLADAIDELLANSLLRRQLAQTARVRASNYTWEAAARATASVYVTARSQG